MISKTKDQKQTLWLRMDKLNRLGGGGTIDGKLIGQELAHVRSDIWAEGKNSNCLMIASIRKHIELMYSK